MKKKNISLALFLIILLCFCSCGTAASTGKEEHTKEPSVSVSVDKEESEVSASVSVTEPEPEKEPEPESIISGGFVISPDRLYATGGRYEQDGDLSNGAETIEWIVIEDRGDSLVMLSKYVLDRAGFNDSFNATDWDNSYIRKYLNSDFYDAVFNDSDKSVMEDYATTYIEASEDAEAVIVTDRVFLLSYDELIGYFPDNTDGADESRQGPLTEYAKEQGVWYVKDDFYSVLGFEEREIPESVKGCGNWWLRTNGHKGTFAMDVAADGTIRTAGHDVGSALDGIRPAIVISISE